MKETVKDTCRSFAPSASSSFSSGHVQDGNNGFSSRRTQPIELLVTNLDSNMDNTSLKKELMNHFRSNAIQVLHVCVLSSQNFQTSPINRGFAQDFPSTCSVKAIVKVATQQDAQIAVSKLHRTKLGTKRMMISNLSSDRSPPLDILRNEVAAIFEDITSKKLPLVTFQDLYEKRYHRSLCMADIHRLRDVIQLITESEGCGGRYVIFNSNIKTKTYSSFFESTAYRSPFCTLHGIKDFQKSPSQWLEQEYTSLPSVKISLKTLAPQIHTLLDTHGGILPLNSIINCYASEFSKEFICDEPPCVPLEHLISCVPGIEISASHSLGFKRIQWLENKSEGNPITRMETKFDCGLSSISNAASEAIAKQLNQFSREVKDLLKSQPHCLIAFSKFVPAYHNHFGRQCCVYQYGYTKLIDLLEAIPHVVQILGEGTKRILTLTHREQTKRFATDMLKVLKAQQAKRLYLKQFPTLFETVFEKPFDVTDYGVCDISDILHDVWEGTVVISREDDDTVVEIPKREQTEDEKERTKVFAKDVIELLQSTPTLSMPFCKFIPAYHHYFNRQCKVSDYGFNKLIELLEEISPHVIELILTNNGEDKLIRLNYENRLKTIGSRLVRLLKMQPNESVSISCLNELFIREYGFGINFEDFDVYDMQSLIKKIPSNFQIVSAGNDCLAKLVDEKVVQTIRCRILRLLMEEYDGQKQIDELLKDYQNRFDQALDSFILYENMNNTVDIDVKRKTVTLCPALKFIRDIIELIQSVPTLFLTTRQLNEVYMQKFSRPLPQPKDFGFKSVISLFQSYGDFVIFNKRQEFGKNTWVLTINRKFIDEQLIVSQKHKVENEGKSEENLCIKDNSLNTDENNTEKKHANRSDNIDSNDELPFPPCEWLPNKSESISNMKPRRIAAKFNFDSNDCNSTSN
ncbi:Limkain-b1-like protein [Dinothrombium tinctorium]|uniref:Limkain-b1-like protein n=1 Tax=Dinothrombium tinctorium TaxID=1965070 RepID=A0A3S3QQN2_9ACAR|nr:Limkain-b1-like protein [Dinothrombium tinctorium]RWS12456.1 Limkain-b1-like protein [Dinothrombium tinctorium]